MPNLVAFARSGGGFRRQQPVRGSAPTSVRWWFPAQVAVFGVNRRTDRGPDPTLEAVPQSGGGFRPQPRFRTRVWPRVGRRLPAKVAFFVVRRGFGRHLTTANASQSGNRHQTEPAARKEAWPPEEPWDDAGARRPKTRELRSNVGAVPERGPQQNRGPPPTWTRSETAPASRKPHPTAPPTTRNPHPEAAPLKNHRPGSGAIGKTLHPRPVVRDGFAVRLSSITRTL